MSHEAKKTYNDWYWNVMVQSSLSRILPLCQHIDENLKWEANEKDFFRLLRRLEDWEHTYPKIDESIRRDLSTIRNFEGYEQLIAA